MYPVLAHLPLNSIRKVSLVGSVVALILAWWWPAAICLVGPLWSVMLLCSLSNYLYRPPEDHIGVVYRFGRFYTYVNPDDYVLLFPVLDRIRAEVSRQPRIVAVDNLELETLDHVHVIAQLQVFYHLDVRRLQIVDLRSTLLAIGMSGTDELIKRAVTSLIHSVVRGMSVPDVESFYHRRLLGELLSRRLANELSPFGLVLHTASSVSILSLHLEDRVRQAKIDRLIAPDKGEALRQRLGPVLGNVHRSLPGEGLTALLAAYAATIMENGQAPGSLFTLARPTVEEDWLSSLFHVSKSLKMGQPLAQNGSDHH